MKRHGKIGLALVLAATLNIGCGGGSDTIIKIITQGDAESCLTDATFLLLVLADKLDDVLSEIDSPGNPNITITNPSEDVWTFDCVFGLLPGEDPDTRITGTIVLTDGNIGGSGAAVEVNDVVISSLGGPITGNADVDVEVVEGSVMMTGSVNLFDEAADCDISLSMPEGFRLLRAPRLVEERRLAADFGGLIISGLLNFGFDFGPGPDLNGSMTVPLEGQEVTVATELLGEFTFKIFPDNETLARLIPCLFQFTDAIDDIASALAEVVDEATGEQESENVSFEGSEFEYSDGILNVNGTVSLVPPSITFSFSDDDSGVEGASDGPITLTLPSSGTGTINGDVNMSGGDGCSATFSFLNTRFDAEAFEDFVGGRTKLVVTLGDDSIELDVDESAEGDDSEFELDGVTVLLNGVELPPFAVLYLIFTFLDL